MILTGTPLAILSTAGAGAGHLIIPLTEVEAGLTHPTIVGGDTEVGAGLTHPAIVGDDHTLLAATGADPIPRSMIGRIITIPVADPTLVLVLFLLTAGHQSTSGTGAILRMTPGMMIGITDEVAEGTAQYLTAYHPGGGTALAATHPGQEGGRGGAARLLFP